MICLKAKLRSKKIILSFHERFSFQNEFELLFMNLDELGSYLRQFWHSSQPLLPIPQTICSPFSLLIIIILQYALLTQPLQLKYILLQLFRMQKNCPTQQELKQTISNLAQNFESDGFVAFGGKAEVNFMGRIILNYKGLRVLKFRKSQLHSNQFSQHQFGKLCQPFILAAGRQQELLQTLQSKFPTSSFCIISGGIHQSTGHLATLSKGQTTIYIY